MSDELLRILVIRSTKAAARYAIGILVIFVSGHHMTQDTAAQRHEMATNQKP